MTDLFEVISEEEFTAETNVGEGEGAAVASDLPQTFSHNSLTYCEFCKGYYNEYHFGREVDDAH